MPQTSTNVQINLQRDASNRTKYICLKVKYVNTFSLIESIPCGERINANSQPKEGQNVLEGGVFVEILQQKFLRFLVITHCHISMRL